MKNIIQFLFLFTAVFAGAILTSCTFTEKIYIEEDGTGSYAMDIDLSEMLDIAKGMGEDVDSETDTNVKINREKIDTTILMTTVLEEKKDSIAALPKEERLLIESMKDAKMHVYMDDDEGKFLMNFVYDFSQVEELKDIQSKVAKAYSISNKKENKSNSLGNTTFVYSKKSFKRTTIAKKMTKKERDELESSIQEMSMFMMGSTYNIEYHFPNKIKNTSAKNATISDDKKTIYISVPFEELIQDENALDFEVMF